MIELSITCTFPQQRVIYKLCLFVHLNLSLKHKWIPDTINVPSQSVLLDLKNNTVDNECIRLNFHNKD